MYNVKEYEWPDELIEAADKGLLIAGDINQRRGKINSLLDTFASMTVWRSLYRDMDLRDACGKPYTAIGLIWQKFSIGMGPGWCDFVDNLYDYVDDNRDQLLNAFADQLIPYDDGQKPLHPSLIDVNIN